MTLSAWILSGEKQSVLDGMEAHGTSDTSGTGRNIQVSICWITPKPEILLEKNPVPTPTVKASLYLETWQPQE